MLSIKQQRFLIDLLISQVLRTKQCLKEKEIFKNRMSFYRSIKYLKEAGLIKIEKESNRYLFSLTLKGEIFSRILLTLPDIPDVQKQFHNLLRKEATKEDIKLLKKIHLGRDFNIDYDKLKGGKK